jgi:hypothetical protein
VRRAHRYADVKPAPRSELPTPAQMVPWGFIMSEARKAIEIAEIGLRSAMTRLGDIEGKLLAAAEIERLARRKGRR